MPDEPTHADSYEALARDVSAWDGSEEAAARFRARLPKLPAPKGKPAGPAEGLLSRIHGLYSKREPISLTDALKEAGAAIRAPFIGDPTMGSWPFHDALHIDDEPAEQWLSVFRSRHVVDEPLRNFVGAMFEARRRELWVPAAEVLGFHATHDRTSLELLRNTWIQCFPKGLPAKWPGGGILASDAPANRHIARHVLSAACWHLAHGEALPDVDPTQLTGVAPPTDPADASAVLLAMTVLRRAEGQLEPVSGWLETHATNIPMDPQCEDALRGILPHVAGAAAHAVRARLMVPRWSTNPNLHTLDALCGWLDTAAWFKERGDAEAVATMRAEAGTAPAALGARLDGAQVSSLERVLALLPVAMDDDVFASTYAAEAHIAELLALLSDPILQRFRWRPLVSRAVGAEAGARCQSGTVGEHALGDLAVELTERGLYVGGLYRGRWYSEEAVLRFARRPALATQVGVQMERQLRLCRKAPAPAARGNASPQDVPPESPEERQVRLLWWLLRSDPPSEAFREIRRVMRGSDTALHRLLETVETVDKERNGPGLRAAYRTLTERAAELIGADQRDHHVAEWLRELASSLLALEAATAAPWEPGEHLERMRGLIAALANWAMWWGLASEEIRMSWLELERRLDPCIRPPHVATRVELVEISRALTRMASATAVLVWPESVLVNTEIARWREWLSHAHVRTNEVSNASARAREALDRGCEAACISLLGPNQAETRTLALLPAADIARLHKFFLQRWLFAQANALAGRAGDRVELMPVRRHLAMVFVGVATGPILIVDFGVVFNSVLLPGRAPAFVATVLLCALGTLAVLGTAVTSPQVAHDGSAASSGAIARLRSLLGNSIESGKIKAKRAAWVWGATFVEAMALSVLVLEILSNNPDLRTLDGVALPWLTQVLLWTSLSQFLGIFIGVVAQGQSLGREDV